MNEVQLWLARGKLKLDGWRRELAVRRNQLHLLLFPIAENDVLLPIVYHQADPGDCGAGCVAMVAGVKGARVELKAWQEWKKRYYRESVGWVHEGMVAMLADLGLRARAHSFCLSHFLVRQLRSGKYVIVSLRVPGIDNLNLSSEKVYTPIDTSKKMTGHLCILRGFVKGKMILSDPRGVRGYGERVEVPLPIFNQIFTGNCVVVELNSNGEAAQIK